MLLALAGVACFLLSVVSRGAVGAFTFILAFIVLVMATAATSSALKLGDEKSIATFRRTTAVVFAGELLWLFSAALGLLFSWLRLSSNALSNAIIFGAFICAGFEFLVINGVFTGSSPLALGLAALYPFPTLVIIRFGELQSQFDIIALAFGGAAFVVFAAFTYLLSRKKTSRGYDARFLFRAFMKTWTARESADLEAAIMGHSEEAEVETKVLRFHTSSGDTFLVLPGVHPGPFHPVGSYDLPGVISRTFEGRGQAMTLHRPGGHERNIATRSETVRYAAELCDFASTIQTNRADATLRGPLQSKVGKATVGATAFSDDLVMTISFAPLGSDDLSSSLEAELALPGSQAGFDTCVVDAHNSIDYHEETPDLSEPGWVEIFTQTKGSKARPFRCAFSHSRELSFTAGEDLTENGVSLFMLEAEGTKHVLVLADANNAVPPVRAAVQGALEASGFRLIEFCTSDSHNLAARGLTVARGYRALGEETDVGSIAKLAADLAKLAETRLAECAYGSGKTISRVKIFGARALDEFASITQASSRLGRSYFRAAAATVGALLLLSLFF